MSTSSKQDDIATWKPHVRGTIVAGALLRDEVIPATGRSKVEIAKPRQRLYDILNERKPV
jgi:hypothetical protein